VLTLADIATGLRPIAVTLIDELAARGFADAPAPLGALVYRPTLYRRNGVAWSSVRSWRADARGRDLTRLKLCKAALDGAVIEAAAAEIAALTGLLFGSLLGWSVTTVACGHSRRSDCFGKRLGQTAALALQLPFIEIFEDRFVSSSSHPKEFRKLPSLVWRTKPCSPVLIIDDLATSGWHMEEALGRVRDLQLPSFGIAWISGTVT
jgi:hypothetical protein